MVYSAWLKNRHNDEEVMPVPVVRKVVKKVTNKHTIFDMMIRNAKHFNWKEQSEQSEQFNTWIYDRIECLDFEERGKLSLRINTELDLTNCNEQYIFFDYNQNHIYYKQGDRISRSRIGMDWYEEYKVHWISLNLLQTSIIRYLLWYYKVKKPKKDKKEYEDKTRQTSIYEFMIPRQKRESPTQYDRLWYKGLDIFSQKDYLTNEQEEIVALKDIEMGDEDEWEHDEMCYWHFNSDCLWNGHDLDCPNPYRHDSYFEDLDEESWHKKRCLEQLQNIVNDFIEISHQPYENFELGIFCHNRRDDCCRGFWPIAYDKYYKLIKEFTQFRCAQMKDELLAAVYHPDRIMSLLAKGYTHDEIMKCYG